MPANLFQSYLAGEAGAFYDGVFTSAADRRSAVARAQRPLSRGVLAELEAQNARWGASTARQQALTALERGAVAVVTGQQVGLFLGPLYTVYKAASAICAARALAAETGTPVVPIFWLQTEDHDLPEIASVQLACAQGDALTLQLPASADNRISVAHLPLPAAITACCSQLQAQLATWPEAAPHLARLSSHYRPGVAWAAAFAHVLAELFEPEGLLLLDPRVATLAQASSAVHARALRHADELASALRERCTRLEQAGFAPEVHVRPDAPLSFFHPAGAEGPRFRLEPAPGGFSEIGGDAVHSLAALLQQLERDPLCFSSSALLRPIIQDTLLPTAAYVGGPSEVAYFAQLAPLYAAFHLPMPLVIPRARFRLLEPAICRLLAKRGLCAADLAEPPERLAHKLAATASRAQNLPLPAALVQALTHDLERTLDSHLDALVALDPQLSAARDKSRASLRQSAAKLGEKYASVLARRDAAQTEELQRLQWSLQPGGVPQERCHGFSYYAARYGERAVLERVLASIDPFDAALRELKL